MTNFRKRENDNSKTRVSSNFKPKKSYFNKFIPRYVIKAIKHNWKRSITTILAIIIAVSLTTSLIMWIETSPRIAISAAMEERAYELRIRNLISNRENPLLDEVQSYINNSEPLVEASYLIQPSVFLFNLNNRLYNLSLSNPPENESDFFISEDYRSGAFLIEEGFLDHLSQQFSFSSSDDNLTTFNNGVAISKRLLLGIELATNQSFKRGDTIDFAIATRIADPERGEDFVYFYQPILFTNITINAIFDRKVQRNLLYPYFFPESLGDGIFISRNLFNQSSIKKMEEQIINPYLFARIDRKSVASMSIYTVTREIEALSFRIEAKSTWLLVDIYTDEIDQILSNYENSQVIILFLFIPLLISASIFFTTVTSYLLEQRKNEIELLRVKGNTFRNIMTLFTVEFVILSGIGVFIGVISGLIITLAISACEYFLVFNIQKIPPNFITTLFMSWQTWIFSALLIELVYIFIAIQKIRGMLLKLQNEKSSTDKYQTRKRLSKRRTDIFIFGMTIALFLLIVQSDVVNRLSIDYHLMGLYLAFATILWFLLSNRLTQYSGDFLPRITRITKFLFKAKNKVISMNIVRKRPQILNILTLIILTVSLGIFSAYYAQTIDANTQKNLNYLIGSDFKVFTEETDVNYSKELEKIQGVSTALSITQTTGSIGSYLVTIVGVNPESYLLGSYWSKESIVDGGPMENMLNNLSANGTSGIIINDFLASTLKMSIGDKLNITGILGSIIKTWNFTVSGILTSAPGVGKLYSQSYSVPGYAKFGGIILINEDIMEFFAVKTTRIFLIKTKENNPDSFIEVHEGLKNQSLVRHIISRQDNNESFFDFLNVAGVAGILSINFLISSLIAIVGVGVFYNFIITKRLKEYAILRVCGGTKNQILWISISESLLIIFIGTLNGFILGIGLCIGFLVMTRPRVISSANIFSLELKAPPILIGMIIVVEFLMLLFAAGIAANKSRNVNVSNFLRNL